MGLHLKTNQTSQATTKIYQTQDDIIRAESIILFNRATSHYDTGTELDLNNFLYVTFHQSRTTPIHDDIFIFYRLIDKYIYTGKNITERIGAIAFPEVSGTRSGPLRSKINKPDHCHFLIFCRSKSEAETIESVLVEIKNDFKSLEWKYGDKSKGSLMYLLHYSLKTFSCDQQYHSTGNFEPIPFPLANARKGQKAILEEVAAFRSEGLNPIPTKGKLS